MDIPSVRSQLRREAVNNDTSTHGNLIIDGAMSNAQNHNIYIAYMYNTYIYNSNVKIILLCGNDLFCCVHKTTIVTRI